MKPRLKSSRRPSEWKWLNRLITRREQPENFHQALVRNPDDIKAVLQFSEV